MRQVSLNGWKLLIGFILFLAFLIQGSAGPNPQIHYAPAENLEKLDVSLIDSAQKSIDLAAYVITDWPVIEALIRAADRGVALRMYLDGGQRATRAPLPLFVELAETPGVMIKVKRSGSPLMHIKAYLIDEHLLRTGSANFSASGLKQQDNDLIVINDPMSASAFKRNFDSIFGRV